MREVRYTLTTTSRGVTELDTDPDGWKEDERQIVRDKTYSGLIYEYAGELTFSGDAYDIITQELYTYGHNAKIILRRDVLNFNEEYELDYIGALDIVTKEESKNTISFKMSDGGISKTIKAQFSEKFELNRLDSINGNDITELELDTITLTGRNLLVSTQLEETELKEPILSEVFTNRIEIYSVPNINSVYSGDENVNGVFPFPTAFYSSNVQTSPNLNSTHFFLLNSDTDKTIRVRVKTDIDITSDVTGVFYFYFLYRYNFDGTNYNFVDAIVLDSITDSTTNTVNFNFDVLNSIDLQEGDCLAAVYRISDVTGQNVPQQETYTVSQRNLLIETEEDSQFRQTPCEGITVYNAINRLTEIITGTPIATSLGLNDYWKHLYITNGFKIRGFDEPITISLKSIIESMKAISGYQYGIENNIFRVDEFSTFYDLSPLMTLDIDDIRESYDDSYLFNTIEVGYKDGGDYEERQGLDEYNVRSIFNHGFESTDNTYDAISEIRADSFAIEDARRKQFEDFPTEDTPYDDDNFFIDCKVDGFIQPRKWQDDFESAPTGIYSPETAQNLRLSPINNLYRISNNFSQITEYRNDITKFTSSEGNSDLSTTLIDGIELKENADIVNNTLQFPTLQPIEVSGVVKLTEAEFKLLKGIVNGQMNAYRSIRYFYKGVEQFGFLKSYNNEGDGSITLIKANVRR